MHSAMQMLLSRYAGAWQSDDGFQCSKSTFHPWASILKRDGVHSQASQGKEGAHALSSLCSGLCAPGAEQRRA